MLHHLRQVTHIETLRHLHLTLRGMLLPHYQLQKSRLARTVSSGETDAVLLADMQINVIQQRSATERDCQICK